MMTSLDRVKEAIAYIKSTQKGLTNDLISGQLYYGATYVSDILGKSKPLSKLFLKRLEFVYSISKEWVLTGKGEMLRAIADPASLYGQGHMLDRKQVVKAEWPGVPVFNVPVAAGIINHASLPAGYVNLGQFKDCVFSVQAAGDDMVPKICNGDHIICKEVDPREIITGDICLVITRSGNEVVRYVQPHKTKNGHISLTSEKQPENATVLALSAIRKIFKVKGFVRNL